MSTASQGEVTRAAGAPDALPAVEAGIIPDRESTTPSQAPAAEMTVVELAQELIRTPSLPGQEGKVAGLIAETMRGCGFHEVWTDAAGNVVGRYRGSGVEDSRRSRHGSASPRTLLFDGHMDTVDIGDRNAWQHDPFGGEIEEGPGGAVLYGRGAADMKSALAAMIYGVKWVAAEEAAGRGVALHGDIIVACVVQEEPTEGVAVRHLIEEEGLQPDMVILGEPTNLGVYLGQRGRVELKVAAYGKAGHASMPQGGVNAISAAARLIFGIELLALQLQGNQTQPATGMTQAGAGALGVGSIAVTRISSNAGSLNSIPDLCELIIDRRLTLGETEARAIAELQSIVNRERIRADISTLMYDMTSYTGYTASGRKYFPPWILPEEDPMARKAIRAVEKVLGVKPRTGFWPFSTDGAYTMGYRGIPTLGFGPGEERHAHTADEHVRVDDIVLAARGYTQLALDLLQQQGLR
jgi:putative selenium metabolism hydrolase